MNDNEEELPSQSSVEKMRVDSEINSKEQFEDISLDMEVIDLRLVEIELRNLIRRRKKERNTLWIWEDC